jgi:hypothetical protein
MFFYGDNSRTVAFRQTKFCTMKDSAPFEYDYGGIFKLLKWMQNLHHSTWDHKILYADRSLEDEQLLIRPLLQESKNVIRVGG